jgi:CRISPR/Cas system-associated protein endoribonuclease Cas2
MAKRFTDTNKYKKPFVRGLQGAYKLLWDYLYHECDHAGIWIVDFEIAQMYLGADMQISKEKALEFFNSDEMRVVEIDNRKQWFLPGFIEFQYGKLNPKNRVHESVISILHKHNLLEEDFSLNQFKVYTSPLQGAKDKDKEKDKFKEQEEDKGVVLDFEDTEAKEFLRTEIRDGVWWLPVRNETKSYVQGDEHLEKLLDEFCELKQYEPYNSSKHRKCSFVLFVKNKFDDNKKNNGTGTQQISSFERLRRISDDADKIIQQNSTELDSDGDDSGPKWNVPKC